MAVFADSRSDSSARRLEIARAGRAGFDATWEPIDADRKRARRALLNKLRIAFRVPYGEWQAALAEDGAKPALEVLELLVFRYAWKRYGSPTAADVMYSGLPAGHPASGWGRPLAPDGL